MLTDEATLWEAVTRGAACAGVDAGVAVATEAAVDVGEAGAAVEDAGVAACGQAAPVGKGGGLCKSAAAAGESRLAKEGVAAPSCGASAGGVCCAPAGARASGGSDVRVWAAAGAVHVGAGDTAAEGTLGGVATSGAGASSLMNAAWGGKPSACATFFAAVSLTASL